MTRLPFPHDDPSPLVWALDEPERAVWLGTKPSALATAHIDTLVRAERSLIQGHWEAASTLLEPPPILGANASAAYRSVYQTHAAIAATMWGVPPALPLVEPAEPILRLEVRLVQGLTACVNGATTEAVRRFSEAFVLTQSEPSLSSENTLSAAWMAIATGALGRLREADRYARLAAQTTGQHRRGVEVSAQLSAIGLTQSMQGASDARLAFLHQRLEGLGQAHAQAPGPLTVWGQVAMALWQRAARDRRLSLKLPEAACLTLRHGVATLPDGTTVDLRRRGPLGRIVHQLCLRRLESPGVSCPLEQIVAFGWPGQDLEFSKASQRAYRAISALRELGLGPYLRRDDRGYAIDPKVVLILEHEACDEPA